MTSEIKQIEGNKFDQGKVRWELLPGDALEQIAEILTFGANKYGDRNWELGMKWSRVYGALMRHMWAWFTGQDNDPETGKSHLAHAGCCIIFLLAYSKRKVGEDDRPTSTKKDNPDTPKSDEEYVKVNMYYHTKFWPYLE